MLDGLFMLLTLSTIMAIACGLVPDFALRSVLIGIKDLFWLDPYLYPLLFRNRDYD